MTGRDDGRPAPVAAATAPVLAGAPLAVVALDLAGRVCRWDDAAEGLFGWSADDVLGGTPPFLASGAADEIVDIVARALAGEPATHDAVTLGRRAGTFTAAVSASALPDDSGQPLAVLLLMRDTGDQQVPRPAPEGDMWRHLALHAVDAVSFSDADGYVHTTSHHQGDTLGYPVDWWASRNGFEVLHPDDVERAADLWADLASTPGARRRAVLRARHARGHYEEVEFTGVNLLDDPAVNSIVVTSRVVSPELQNERLLANEAQVLKLIARDAPLDEVWQAVVTLVEYHTGAAAAVLLGPHERPMRLHADATRHPGLLALVERHTTTGIEIEDPGLLARSANVPDLAGDARTRPWGTELAAAGFAGAWTQPILGPRSSGTCGMLAVLLATARSPTAHERKVVQVAAHLAAVAVERSGWQEELRRRGRSDELTGLPNRIAIFEHLAGALAGARVQRDPVTAMVIDLDRFKLVNDSLGHDFGDQLLVLFAERLREVAGERHFVGRMAADEFVLVFAPGVRLRAAKMAARQLIKALDEPFTVDDEDIHLTVSIGLAMSAQGRESADALLQRADDAMFRAKAAGRDRIEVHDERLRARAIKRLEIDRELRMALERGELQLHYQPQVNTITQRIVGAEALLRWQHPTRGLIQPDAFVNIAEESGTIVPIGHWVLDEAVRQARTWTDAHAAIAPFAISVNLSARQLINRSLVDTVAFVLTRYDWPPSQLTLELTESILIEDRDATLYVLNRLRMLGVKLAIDDFGTGFASLDYLHRLHVDWIKIDRSFVRMIDAEGNGSPVATAMMHLARAFELGVIAEGVEEHGQLDGLRTLGCDLVQGFLFARPLAHTDLEVLLGEPCCPTVS